MDPRSSWDLPALGGMPRVTELDELATRVLAPNPNAMTLDGTNTYVLGETGRGAVVVVDPGPDDLDHRRRVEQVAADRDAEIAAIVVTHHHGDHLEAASAWAERYGCRVHATRPQDVGSDGVVIADGDRVQLPGLTLDVVATPGHTRDHVAFRLPTGSLLTGDHVLGRGTSVVAHPDGDLVAYLASLRRVLDLGPAALYPGHGPELVEDPDAVVRFYLDHRDFRRQQVLAILGEGPATPPQLVERIYAAVDPGLWSAAEASTRALVAGLVTEQLVVHGRDDTVSLRG